MVKKSESLKNAILLVLPIEDISLRPELSSPPRFRIQGRYPERYGRTEGQTDGRRTAIIVFNIGFFWMGEFGLVVVLVVGAKSNQTRISPLKNLIFTLELWIVSFALLSWLINPQLVIWYIQLAILPISRNFFYMSIFYSN